MTIIKLNLKTTHLDIIALRIAKTYKITFYCRIINFTLRGTKVAIRRLLEIK